METGKAGTRLGTLVGRFRLVERLGRGSSGTVYRAADTTLGRDVAVKLLRPESRLHGESKARFQREAKVLSQLDHPNLCQVHDFIEDELDDAIVLELVDGQDLTQARESGLSLPEKMRIAEAIASALCAVHRQGILHRDLKPQNIMIREDGVVKILDFGLARIEEAGPITLTLPHSSPATSEAFRQLAESDEGLTEHGAVMGTPAFMSPEQAQGLPVTPASDMYSFGLILEELFCSEPHDRSREHLSRRSKKDERASTWGIRPDLQAITTALLSKRAVDRPTAEAALGALRKARRRNRQRAQRAAIAAALLFLTLAGAKNVTDVQRERSQALQAEERADTTIAFLVDMFDAVRADTKPLDQTTVKDLFEKAVEDLPESMPADEATRVRIVNALGSALLQLGLISEMEPLLAFVDTVVPETLDEPLMADRLLYLQSALAGRQGDLEAREELARRRLALDIPEERARGLNELAQILKDLQRLEEAESVAREAIGTARKEHLDQDTDASASTLVSAQLGLGYVLDRAGRFTEMRLVLEEARELSTFRFGAQSELTSRVLQGLGLCAMKEARYEESAELTGEVYRVRRALLGREHPDVALAASNYASRLTAVGRHEEAVAVGEEALAIRLEIFGEEHFRVAFSLESVGWSKVGMGDVEEGRSMIERALAMRLKLEGDDAENLKIPYRLLAQIHRDAGRFELAESYLRKQLELAEARLAKGLHSEGRSNAISSLATVYVRAGWRDKARDIFPDLIEARVEERGPEHRQTLRDARKYADFLTSELQDEAAAAEILARFGIDEEAAEESQ